MDEIQQSYELGFTPYRLHKNQYGIYDNPIRVYDESVYVLDNVATMNVTDWYLEAGSSKLMGVAALLCKEIEDPLGVEV